MNLILCADSLCPKKDTCQRFTTDPLNEISARQKTRIEATFRQHEESCRKYKVPSLPITIKTK